MVDMKNKRGNSKEIILSWKCILHLRLERSKGETRDPGN